MTTAAGRRLRPARSADFDPARGPGGGLFEETRRGPADQPGPGDGAGQPAAAGVPGALGQQPARGRAAPADRRARLRAEHASPSAPFGGVRRDPVRLGPRTARTYDPDAVRRRAAQLRLGPVVPEQPVRDPEQLRRAAQRHLAVRQPRRPQRRGQGAAAAQRGADGPVLPHRQLPDAAPGRRLLHAGRRLPDHQRRGPRPEPGATSDLQAFGFGTTIGLPPEFQDGVPGRHLSIWRLCRTPTATTPEPGHRDGRARRRSPW